MPSLSDLSGWIEDGSKSLWVLLGDSQRCYCGAALDVPGGSGSELGFKSVSQMLHEITAMVTPGG